MSVNELQNDEFILAGGIGQVIVAETIREVNQLLRSKDGSVTLTIGARDCQQLWDEIYDADFEIIEPKQLIKYNE